MTCKDCMCLDACVMILKLFDPQITDEEIVDVSNRQHGEKRCCAFKNKVDMVEVVRCKDCGYFRKGDSKLYGICNRPLKKQVMKAHDDFCSDARRKDWKNA